MWGAQERCAAEAGTPARPWASTRRGGPAQARAATGSSAGGEEQASAVLGVRATRRPSAIANARSDGECERERQAVGARARFGGVDLGAVLGAGKVPRPGCRRATMESSGLCDAAPPRPPFLVSHSTTALDLRIVYSLYSMEQRQ
jgi:hypothetical protein